ncbi:MAG TPA: hypothetical protein VN253_22475 [Kofleriaceae bacterium]|nr:hypothetical protein [Kofleriaceae bacterium]
MTRSDDDAQPAPPGEARRRRPWLLAGAALIASAAAILLVFGRGRGGGSSGGASGGAGGPDDDAPPPRDAAISLIVHAPAGSADRLLRPGDPVQPGAPLRFEVHAARPGYVAVVGIDGAGDATVHYPLGGLAPSGFDPRDRLLPGATALDATPGDERLVAVYAERPFSLDAVVAALRTRGPLSAGVASSEVVLHKTADLPP